MTTLIVILSLIAALWLALWLSPAHRVFFRDTLDAAPALADPPAWPSVTLVVPARNEASMLPGTIPTMCAQDYPGEFRVIAVDDQSEDATPEILAEQQRQFPNLTVVHATDRPAGWCGKPWAVAEGVRQAGAPDLFLFTDADVRFHPHAVRQAVRLLHAGQHDLVSLFPQLDFGSTAERIGLTGLVTVLALMFPAGVVNDPRSTLALASGGFILVRRGPYEAVGGHACVRSLIIEDINLAKQVKAAGGSNHIRLTTDLLHTRMYEDFADMWEGLTKNAYAGMDYQPRKFFVGLLVGLLIAVLPPLYLIASLVALAATWPGSPKLWAIAGLSTAINVFMALIHRRTVRHFRLPWYHSFLMPVSLALYQAIAVGSYYQHHHKGGSTWKGRRYAPATVTAAPPPVSAAPAEGTGT